ncbi:MAG: aminotransferase class IV, partial [Bacteroidetes bacterium]|nr:aminotransferase class IV [Bacteroidota bacterium]
MNYINIDGQLFHASEASVSCSNRAFRYGYGLFETMLLREGQIELKQYHWERLFSGLQQLHFDIPRLFTIAHLEEEVLRTVKKNKLETLCRIRLQVYAGNGGLYDAADQKPHYIIECFPLQRELLSLNENGLQLCIANGLQKSMDSLANLKSCNALIYAMAAQQAKQQRCNDALIVNTSGNIIESTIANIFWVKDNVIYTPPLSEGCVAGVMRRHIIAALAAQQISVKETPLILGELHTANEVFLTNAIRRIKWVAAIHDITYKKEM